MAQGVFEKLVADSGLADKIQISSAGTGDWHVGSPPDSRAQSKARQHGIALTSRAQQFRAGDFSSQDLILAMDQSNLDSLFRICPDPRLAERMMLFRSFDPDSNGDLDVPDPYYGGAKGFDTVFQIIERTCPKILEYIQDRAGIAP